MKRFSYLAIVLFSIAPLFVSAHGNKYLEFNPDYFRTKSLNVSSAGNIYEILLPVNEFLGGMDFWFDNAGNSGNASFELRDQSNNPISTKSVIIPHIDPTSGGQRVHVDFNSQISVIGGNLYKVKISSSLPQLQIYYADRVKFLPHNEPHMSDYVNGAAEVNGEEQQFSFKFSLYETNESSSPIISNVAWTVISETQMRLDFNVNEPADYKIEYGLSSQGYNQSTSFNNDYEFCITGVAVCSLIIPTSPNASYQYLLTVKDLWGNQSQVTGSFTSGEAQTSTPTPPPIDNPPVISNLRIVDVANDSVSVAWTTNEVTNSYLLIRFSGFISIAAVSDSTFELEHYLEIESGLSGSTPYSAEVTSVDLVNNQTRASISFATLGLTPSPSPSPTAPPPPSPPSPTSSLTPSASSGPSPTASATPSSSPQPSVSTFPSGSGDSSTAQITWSPPSDGEPSDGYRVDVFDKDGNLIKTVYVPAGSYQAEVDNLAEGEYTTIIYENDKGVFKKVVQPKTFKAGDESFVQRLLALWPYLILVVILIGASIWWFKKRSSKIVQPVVS